MTCAYGQGHRLSNEPTSITHGTPPPIRNGENPKKMNMSGAIMSIYLHWEEREPVLEELIVLPKLNFQHMFTLNHILASFFFFFILKANLVLVKDARLTGRVPFSPCRLLPKCAPLLLSSLLLPDAEKWFPGWELSLLIQSYTTTKDYHLQECVLQNKRDNKGRVE